MKTFHLLLFAALSLSISAQNKDKSTEYHVSVKGNDSHEGSPVKVNTDYFGNKRNTSNPFPGPIEVKKNGKQEWRVWPK